MTKSRIKTWIAAGLLTASATYGEILYQKDGISLEGSVRMVHRNAAICQVLEENESAESYERTKSNHGQPLHVWRLDYSVLNGSGQALSDVTAHFQIEAQWPPCTNWTGLGQYPRPVQWAGSFETIQRTGGLQPGGEAAATTYVLAFDSMQPRFGRRQVTYRFGEAAAAAEAPAAEAPAPVRVPSPLCDGMPEGALCWKELRSRPGCYVWDDHYYRDQAVAWSGECRDGVATGTGTMKWSGADGSPETWVEDSGLLVDGKRQGRWVVRWSDGHVEQGPYVDGVRHGDWYLRAADDRERITRFVHGEAQD